ncbi:hypothetical protein I6M49_22005 [Shewanella algae]|uniref:hypothetical protein n=1 Tax=Shewanella algae TaxID=38313 RepID=UPI001AAC9E0C|nr:hypothetical protein [Shewanella algae]MBO2656120.1 hypothetical protein [Shewanella algae]
MLTFTRRNGDTFTLDNLYDANSQPLPDVVVIFLGHGKVSLDADRSIVVSRTDAIDKAIHQKPENDR